MSFLGIGSESGFLGTGIGAKKPKRYQPAYLTIDFEDYANPSKEYRGQIMREALIDRGQAPRATTGDLYGGATIDRSGITDTRYHAGLQRTGLGQQLEAGAMGEQQTGLGMLRQAAQGAVPSAAELQLRSGLQQSLAQQAALAASARGGAGAQILARGQAAQQAAGLAAQANQQAAALRANEQATARQAYQTAAEQARAQALTGQQLGLSEAELGLGVRGQNIGLATTQAQLGQQAGLAGQEQTRAYDLANLQAALAQQQMNDAYRAQMLNALNQIDTRTMAGREAWNNLRIQQNVALQGGLMGQTGDILGQYGRTQAATGAALSPVAGLSSIFGGSTSGGGGGGGAGGLLALFA